MPILKNINIPISRADLPGRGDPAGTNEKIQAAAARALDLSRRLLQPGAAFRWMDDLSVQKDRIVCYDKQSNTKTELDIGPDNTLITRAESVLISIATLGPKLDETIGALNQSGDYLTAYFMDHIGVTALEKISGVICSLAEKRARNNGWGVSPFISPGAMAGCDLSLQKTFFELIPHGRIGVQLNAAGMMTPLKTVSGLVAVGPGFSNRQVPPLCSTCACAGKCGTHYRGFTREVLS